MDKIEIFLQHYPWLEISFWLLVLFAAAAFVNFIVKLLLEKILNRLILSIINGRELLDAQIIARLSNVAPALIISSWVGNIPGLPAGIATAIQNIANAFIIMFVALSIGAAAGLAGKRWQQKAEHSGRSIKSYVQVAKIILYGVAAILMIAAITNRSPLILFSGLGALTAVLLLVFKDTILSFIASIQISSTDIVRVGDWITMPSMNTDGAVRELSLYSVTVQNWDNTYATFPIRKLVEDPFTNWRGMSESGGRRIKRALYIDQNSVHFLGDAQLRHLSRLRWLSSHIETKTKELESWNKALGEASRFEANRRRLTNLGVFRAYVQNYLTLHPAIRRDMTILVRQLPLGPDGLPLELYCFTATTDWNQYEDIQSDIFDHLLAILPEFQLSVFQSPAGRDFMALAQLSAPWQPA